MLVNKCNVDIFWTKLYDQLFFIKALATARSPRLGCALISKFLRLNSMLVDLNELSTRISIFLIDVNERALPAQRSGTAGLDM